METITVAYFDRNTRIYLGAKAIRTQHIEQFFTNLCDEGYRVNGGVFGDKLRMSNHLIDVDVTSSYTIEQFNKIKNVFNKLKRWEE